MGWYSYHLTLLLVDTKCDCALCDGNKLLCLITQTIPILYSLVLPIIFLPFPSLNHLLKPTFLPMSVKTNKKHLDPPLTQICQFNNKSAIYLLSIRKRHFQTFIVCKNNVSSLYNYFSYKQTNL